MYHIAIVEDEEIDRKLIISFIERYQKETEKSFKVTEFKNAINFLTEYSPVFDIVFIDIQMPHMNGMEAAEKLREIDSAVPIVFITNMATYAVKGYSVNAVDFVVKPITYINFSVMLKKVLRLVDNLDESIILKCTVGKVKLRIDEISYLDVFNHQTYYHTDNGEYIVWESLKEQEEKLPQDRFAKCNNYCLVNLKYVDGVTEGEVKIGDKIFPVSRSKKKEFTDKLLAFYGKYL
jgi:DNA-binding LytR/AlgR family response regulator